MGRPCGLCTHDPSCGQASAFVEEDLIWFCHTDDHSCYDMWVDHWAPLKMMLEYDE